MAQSGVWKKAEMYHFCFGLRSLRALADRHIRSVDAGDLHSAVRGIDTSVVSRLQI